MSFPAIAISPKSLKESWKDPGSFSHVSTLTWAIDKCHLFIFKAWKSLTVLTNAAWYIFLSCIYNECGKLTKPTLHQLYSSVSSDASKTSSLLHWYFLETQLILVHSKLEEERYLKYKYDHIHKFALETLRGTYDTLPKRK